jgi:tRNA(fMet)-specific endonuclease VapC
MLYLLDTSVCVSLLRGRATETRLPEVSECALSVITVAELEVGVRRSSRPAAQRKAVHALVGVFDVLPWDFDTTGHYGDIRVDLEKRGVVIGPLDLLIAAHARRLGATIITANAREFRRVDGLPCLEWTFEKP